ncbi:hypothetical protein EIN_445300 [Entamoeba invadens IP1]|uniref:Uncharacterized protein n=1 Tax=Entamoeba invadens IP1 TaxID=370355 RepID=L7FMV0_ENTIV|nr:hypothetical protein EIN_445300 [Entamoeba invadens IP1]ELP86903.1 hypothetical protein EIN_445300 [Entamoeba invadens IP1]|eukprot:XP_004253674.1 hypothetical protein EIN_445300 [Entamoeba invadens IP1]
MQTQQLSAFTKKNIYEEYPTVFSTVFYPFNSHTSEHNNLKKTKKTEVVNDSINNISRLLQAKRASADRDAAQQGFLISVLALNGFEVKMNKLYKKGKTTHQLYVIDLITREGTVYFNLNDFHLPSENLKQKRRSQDALTNNILIEIAEKFCGAVFKLKNGKKSNVCIPMKRIQTANVNGVFYTAEKILVDGIYENENIRDNLKDDGFVVSNEQINCSL